MIAAGIQDIGQLKIALQDTELKGAILSFRQNLIF